MRVEKNYKKCKATERTVWSILNVIHVLLKIINIKLVNIILL